MSAVSRADRAVRRERFRFRCAFEGLLDLLAVGRDPMEVDLVVSGILGFHLSEIPYLVYGLERGWLLAKDDMHAVPGWDMEPLVKAPPMPLAARAASSRILYPLKVLARPITDKHRVATLFKRIGVIQDVYLKEPCRAVPVRASKDLCTKCMECVRACPERLSWDEVGSGRSEACLRCMYCVWSCPTGAMDLAGDLGMLARTVERYAPVSRRSGLGRSSGRAVGRKRS